MSSLYENEYRTLDEAIAAVEKDHPKLAELFYSVSILDPLWISRYIALRQMFTAAATLAEAVLDGEL